MLFRSEHEALIGTVRNVGYRFVMPDKRNGSSPAPTGSSAGTESAEEGADEVRASDALIAPRTVVG